MIQNAFDSFGDRRSTIHLKDYDIINGKKAFVSAGTGLLNIGLIFDNIEKMNKKPQIILDELSLSLYDETVKRISEQIH